MAAHATRVTERVSSCAGLRLPARQRPCLAAARPESTGCLEQDCAPTDTAPRLSLSPLWSPLVRDRVPNAEVAAGVNGQAGMCD